ncbi:hypothetical protein [Bradyrhizobium sp. UFLA05-112]
MLKAFITGAIAISLIVAPTAAGAMSTHQKTHKTHHAKKMEMAPGTTTGMSSGTTTTEKATSGAKAKSGY